MTDDIKSTICSKAWNYPIINLANNELTMCCHTVHQRVQDNEIENLGVDIFTKFQPIQETKFDLLKGIKSDSCSYCWRLEEKNIGSSRTGFDDFARYVASTNYFNTYDKREVANKLSTLTIDEKFQMSKNLVAPKNIEIFVGNHCDLKCVYCNEWFSSQWMVEKKKYDEIDQNWKRNDGLTQESSSLETVWWDWFENHIYDKPDIIAFLGGEPLLMNKLYSHIDRILNKYNSFDLGRPIWISIVSNFNTPPAYFDKFMKLIPKILETPWVHLDLSVSIESLGDKTEFIRTGAKWDRIEKNIRQLLSAVAAMENRGKFSFNIMSALNALAIPDLPNFYRFIVDIQREYDIAVNVRGSQVVYPNWLQPSILSESFSENVDEAIEILSANKLPEKKYRFGPWLHYISHLQEVKKAILDPDKNLQNRREFVWYIRLLEERRGINFRKTFPELVDFFNMCDRL